MLKNFFKIAARTIIKEKLQSAIKLLGLTLGCTSFLLINLFVLYQLEFDKGFDDSDRVYRLNTIIKGKGGNLDFHSATASPPVAVELKQHIPGIESVVRIVKTQELLSNETHTSGFYEDDGYSASADFFNIFSYKLLEGDRKNVLQNPDQIALSSSLKSKFFGNEPALGKIVYLGSGDSKKPMTVTAVFETKNVRSHLQPSFIMSMPTTGIGQFVMETDTWVGQNFVTQYLKLDKKIDPKVVVDEANQLLQLRASEQLKSAGLDKSLYLQPIIDIQLRSAGIENNLHEVSSETFLQLLTGIGFFILLMASANYINLTTSQSIKRSKEIGVRKVNGATDSHLASQFLIESFVLVLLAFLISIPLIQLILPGFNDLSDASLAVGDLFDSRFILTSIVTIGVMSLFSGAYPAFYLSRIHPAQIFRFSTKQSRIQNIIKNGLIIFQFVMVFILLFGVLIIRNQIEFIRTKDLGFRPENKVVIPLQTRNATDHFSILKTEFSNIGTVSSVSGVEFIPSTLVRYDARLYKNAEGEGNPVGASMNLVTDGYYDQMHVLLMEGRDVKPGDSNQAIVNETFLEAFGLELKNAIGTKLYTRTENQTDNIFEIVGIHKDFNQVSLKEPVVPTMSFYTDTPDNMVITFRSGNNETLIDELESAWNKTMPDEPFEFKFLPDEIHSMYKEEERTQQIGSIFSSIAILLGMLGIWGVVSHAMTSRLKEIGIRKVLGASVSQVYLLVCRKYLWFTCLSAAIGIPIAMYFGKSWLSNFAYKEEEFLMPMALAFLTTLLIAVISMSYSILKGALINPVKTLKSE